MNVAITRARMKLIILGDASTMTRHPFYKKLYDYILSLRHEASTLRHGEETAEKEKETDSTHSTAETALTGTTQ